MLTGFGAIDVDVVALLLVVLDLDRRNSAASLFPHQPGIPFKHRL